MAEAGNQTAVAAGLGTNTEIVDALRARNHEFLLRLTDPHLRHLGVGFGQLRSLPFAVTSNYGFAILGVYEKGGAYSDQYSRRARAALAGKGEA